MYEPRVLPQPNTYENEEQRQDVFLFLQAMGWLFNEENKNWYKEPLKDKNGLWNFQTVK